MARMSPERAAEPISEVERHYRRLLEEHARSGLTQSKFAAKKRIAASTLSWWRHEVVHRDELRNGKRKSPARRPKLVAVEVVAPPSSRNGAEESHAQAVELTVRLRSGHVVRVPHGFDAAELKRLVEVLGAC